MRFALLSVGTSAHACLHICHYYRSPLGLNGYSVHYGLHACSFSSSNLSVIAYENLIYSNYDLFFVALKTMQLFALIGHFGFA